MPVCVTSTCVISICATSGCVMSVCVCGLNLYDVKLCDVNLCDVNLCDVNLCDVKLCDVNLCDVNLCDVKLCDVNLCDVNLCGVNLCDVKLCDVNLCDFNLCDVNLCDVNLCDVKLCDVNLCDVNLCDVKLCDVSVRVCDVNLCGVCLCDVNLCDVNLCDFNLCDVNLCDVNLCDVKLCDVNLCDVNLCDVKLCDVSVRVCDVNLCGVCLCDVNLCNANLCAQLPQTQFTHSKAPNPRASKTSTQNFRTSYWHSYPKRNLHTARRQTRMLARHPRKIFAPPIGTAAPNAIYTQQGTKPACQQDIHTNFSHLLSAQLPRTQFTRASRQTRMPGRHRRKPPNPDCQEDINAKFSHLLLAQLPRTQFTHSAPPNPHASNTSRKNFRSSYWHSYPERNLHRARRQTRMPAGHQRKIFAAPIGTATPSAIYTQQAAKPACQQDINAKFSQLLLAQLPRTQFTQSTPPNPHASKTSTQNLRSSYWHSYPEQHLHTARPQTRMPATHPHKIFAAPIGTATPNSIYTQQAAKPECQQDINAKFSQLLLAQLPRTTFTHSKAPNPNASNTSTQNFRTSKSHAQALQVPRLPRKSSGRAAEPKTRQSVHQTPRKCSKPHACHAKAAAERRSPKRAKAYIRPRASAPSPTPATQKQRKSGGAQNAPKRTPDPAQALQVPGLARKSSGRAAEPKTRQSVHQTPRKCSKPHACHAKQRQSGGAQNAPKRTSDPAQKCSKSHACHAKAAAKRRSPKRAKAYIRPRASAPSPTPATQKQRQSGGAQNAPKRTSDPAQMLQVPRLPRLPRKSSGRAAEPKTRQSVHQTPGKCSKPHACHAKAAAERRSPKRAKAYIRPRASAPSPTPATQKQRQSGGAQNAPKRTSDPGQVLQVPRLRRLPRKSSGRAAEPKTRQSVHQTPGKRSKPHACHAKAAAERRSPKRAKAYIRPRASAPSPTPATPAAQKQRQSGGAQNAPKRTSDPGQALQAPRLPRKSSGRAAEPKTRQSVHQTPRKCSKSHACHAKAAAERRSPKTRQSVHQTPGKCSKPHACHAKAAAERRSPKRAKAYIRPPWSATSPTPATQNAAAKAASSCVMSSCVMSSCVMSMMSSTCAMSSCVMSSCVMSTCVMSSHVMSSSVMSSYVMCVCVVCLCVFMLHCVMWCEAMWCEAVWREAVWCQAVWCVYCVVVLLCVLMFDVVLCEEEGEARKRGGGVRRRCQPKNKNPTRQCGEQGLLRTVSMGINIFR